MEPLTQRPPGLEVPESMIYFVYLVTFLDVIAACISTPVMPYYAESFGVPTAYIGYLYATWSFTSAVFAPMLSGMSDKWGRKRVLVTCLVGAGTANIIQGLAINCGSLGFWVFLFGRAFSGVWASVGATCNVYISDVTSEGPLREKYLAQLSMVPVVAIMTGPGIGGGLAAAFGYNVPILIDGVMTLFSAFLAHQHMVETPAFLRSQAKLSAALPGSPADKAKNTPAIPSSVHILGAVSFVGCIASQGNLAMYALFFQKVYGFTTLYVGFYFMASAVIMMLTQLLIVTRLRKYGLPPIRAASVGGSIGGIGTMLMGFSGLHGGSLHTSLAAAVPMGIGNGIFMSQSAAVTASLTTVENRGKVFGLVQTYQNVGKIIGPIVSSNVGSHGFFGIPAFMGLPFCLNGGVSLCAMAALFFVRLPQKKEPLQKKLTEYGDKWENEAGSDQDVIEMGKFVTQLLAKRHYKWVTRRAEIETILDNLLPELTTADRESYDTHMASFKCNKCANSTIFETSIVGV